ncbi:hypothetical protein HYU92_01315 [Candidatus Curtissbacteria bacterium]|nr:hypothetical protein [Candidatus Curtissbacteria bacterium]
MVFLKQLWRKWLVIAHAIGNFQAQVILSIFYFILFLPLGLVLRFFVDPLRMKKIRRTNFQKWEHPKETLEGARKQY